jgi:hypothetical protein
VHVSEAAKQVDRYFDSAPKVWTERERALALVLHFTAHAMNYASTGCRITHLQEARDYFNERDNA